MVSFGERYNVVVCSKKAFAVVKQADGICIIILHDNIITILIHSIKWLDIDQHYWYWCGICIGIGWYEGAVWVEAS